MPDARSTVKQAVFADETDSPKANVVKKAAKEINYKK